MSRKRDVPASPALAALARVLDQYEGRYRELRGCPTFGEYVAASGGGADEETLTEPILASILEDVLGFGKGDYFPQMGKSGLKPDFTPTDLVTHRFVLDAKGSGESLTAHVAQIRRYVEQRSLRFGVLFNGRQLRVYPSGSASYDRALSFELVPLWRAARGEQLAVGPDFPRSRRSSSSSPIGRSRPPTRSPTSVGSRRGRGGSTRPRSTSSSSSTSSVASRARSRRTRPAASAT